MIRTPLDRVVVAAWRVGRLADVPLRYGLRREQSFFHYPGGEFVEIRLTLLRTLTIGDEQIEEYGPASVPPPGYDAIVHTHQDRRRDTSSPMIRNGGHQPIPGPRDGVVPFGQRIPNYGLSSVGAWVVRPGPALTVELLDGRWGARFNPEAFAAALNRGRGDVNAGSRPDRR